MKKTKYQSESFQREYEVVRKPPPPAESPQPAGTPTTCRNPDNLLKASQHAGNHKADLTHFRATIEREPGVKAGNLLLR